MARSLHAAAVAACSVVAALAAPASASAFEVASFSVTPSTTQAGGHPDLAVAATIGDPGPDLREVVLGLPPGLVGNPQAAERCTSEQFAANACPAGSVVGSASADADATVIVLPIPITATGDVFNLEPRGDEPGRLGIRLEALGIPIVLEAPITLRADTVSLRARISDVPREAAGIPITVKALSFTLDGVAPGGTPFLTNPTTCAPATSGIALTAYDGSSDAATDAFTPTGCDAVPFAPALAVEPQSTVARTPTGATIRLDVPADELPVRQSYVRDVRVALPEGVALNAPVGAGLEGCADEAAPACPAASDVGDARVDTPLVGALTGDVFLGAPLPDDPYRLIVVLARPGVRLVLRGSVALDERTGRVTATFRDLPQVPFTRFALTFRGGDRAVLRQSSSCGEQVATATLTPHSGGPAREARATYGVGGCLDALTPGLTAEPSTTQAGASPSLALTIDRPDRQPELRDLELSLPPGLLGRLAGVPLCRAPGSCGDESRVGSVDVLAGAGGDPLALRGAIHLAKGGAGELAALVVSVPARVGPFDLGTVVLRSGLRLRPDGGLDVSARDLPALLRGIPLELRRLVLRLDRPGFLRNPATCGPASVTAWVNGAAATAPYPVTGCEALPFAPRLTATVSGGRAATRRGGRPALTTTIAQAPGEATIRSAAVTLPDSFAANLGALGNVCKEADVSACPPASRVGRAEAASPLLAEPLRGPVVLLEAPGQALPKLVVLLGGAIDLRLDAAVSFDTTRRIVATFPSIPDVPVSRFALTFDGGPAGLTQAGQDLCGEPLPVTGVFTSHGDVRATDTANAAVEGCGSVPRVTLSLGKAGRAGRPSLLVRVTRAPGGSALRGVSVTLPSSLVARGRSTLRADGRRVRSRRAVRVKPDMLVVSRRASRSLELRYPAGRLRLTRAARRLLSRGRRPALRFGVEIREAGGPPVVLRRTVRARR